MPGPTAREYVPSALLVALPPANCPLLFTYTLIPAAATPPGPVNLPTTWRAFGSVTLIPVTSAEPRKTSAAAAWSAVYPAVE